MPTYMDELLLDLKAMLDNPPATIDGFRSGWDDVMERVIAAVEPVEGVQRTPVDAGGVPGCWFDPADARRDPRACLFLHGGGYAFRSVETHRDLIARLALACRARILAVDYALAPEGPFPAGATDAATAYGWMLTQGHEPAQTAILGDSAGGGLAFATLVRLKQQGGRLPGAAATISAWLDFEALGESMERCTALDPFCSRQIVLLVAAMYLRDTTAREASPLYADLHGLPPTLLIAGENEVLRDDTVRMGEAFRAAGVETEVSVYPGRIHDFPLFEPTSDDGRRAITQIAAFVTARC